MSETRSDSHYYVPPPSHYPVTVNLGLFILVLGFVLRINAIASGVAPILAGMAVVLYGAFGWLGKIICEDESGNYRPWEDSSFRIGMAYFILSEIAFFASFLLALMYVRAFALPELSSMDPAFTLWPDFKETWPSGGPKSQAFTPLNAWGIPAANTILILASAASMMWARKGLSTTNRGQMVAGLAIALVLGVAFLFQEAMEYHHAAGLGVTLASGVYGTNFYMLTGVHGMHLLAGLIMLIVLLLRAFHGHFKAESRVGLDLVSWYWNFVVVIPGLLIFVYFYWL
ncbi:cytochrome c oxidase subunit 3 [Candidatus Ferrigenium straubiae]|jgi:cytochrome c oxidase subunit 3|uniref:cytochrome c oxidase subunit 3 n=1 Tax=Candidatus Ferrigenium straubiae TaxID=2919506 RepID=UPI003F4AE3F3